MSDWSFFLNIGTTFATFNWSGNMPVVIDWLIISVIHSHISFAILFSVIALRLSWPQLCNGVNLDRWCIVVALSICSKLKVDSIGVFR